MLGAPCAAPRSSALSSAGNARAPSPSHALPAPATPSRTPRPRPRRLGRIALNAYFVSKTEDSASFEFCVNAYPKSLDCRANSASEMDEWIKVLMQPLEELSRH